MAGGSSVHVSTSDEYRDSRYSDDDYNDGGSQTRDSDARYARMIQAEYDDETDDESDREHNNPRGRAIRMTLTKSALFLNEMFPGDEPFIDEFFNVIEQMEHGEKEISSSNDHAMQLAVRLVENVESLLTAPQLLDGADAYDSILRRAFDGAVFDISSSSPKPSPVNDIALPGFPTVKATHMALCTICQFKYNVDDDLHEYPCQHLFHVECSDMWIRNGGRKCPSCVQPLARS